MCKSGRARSRNLFYKTHNSVLFLKDGNIIVTRVAWYVTAELNVSLYEEAIAIVRSDFMLMHEQSKEYTSIAELKQIEVLLNSLESKLHYFYQLLPRPDIRRGMINMGEWVLKALFGTATSGDILHLHQALDKLQGEEADVVHSLENQMSYIIKSRVILPLKFIGSFKLISCSQRLHGAIT